MKERLYKSVVLISFLILLFVELRLTYNTYVLRDRDYRIKDKTLINDEYGRSIPDDKLYKGGGKIIDSILSRNMPGLNIAYERNDKDFKALAARVNDTLFLHLKAQSSMDSIFKSIVKRNGLDPKLQYLLTFESIEIVFNKNKENVFLFNRKSNNETLLPSANPFGVIIDGTLTFPDLQNRVTHLSVSGTLMYDYRITFNLFVDSPGRPLKVAKEMLPTFLLVALCIAIIVAINYYTYINWMRQKKEAEVKSDFLNSIKHEFNTPVTTILVASKSLHEDAVLNDRNRVKELVNIVERQALRLHSHINQMLEISEINNEINLEKTDLNYSVLAIVNDFKIKVPEPHSLAFDPHHNEILLMIDPFMFTTMLQNMLDNSLIHNLSTIKKTAVFISEESDDFVLHIKDNGKGIEAASISKVFDKFFREERDKNVPGLGLGLYYVKQSVDLHRWRIDIKSEISTGTEFLVYIPKKSVYC
ncbi:sensor histidine kinase [Pedobacter agri]|uniref:sensor histidine kinase n=1 Tax=Pedobacter agri TaxID=454586 RepID=UPI00278A595A|nr:HAMP domain-containing sensor histidine kinase [Pedobacter agri]MDQ1142736.1 two-component system phosphate regulon sensor histidine kinase PhoR [Pedobacter agri]